jgi:hypothetical protein
VLSQYLLLNEEDKIGMACSMHGREKLAYKMLVENLKEVNH